MGIYKRAITVFCLLLTLNTFFAQNSKDSTTVLSAMSHSYPNWSPDGKKIAFMSNMLDDNNEIYVMNIDGTARTRLTFNKWSDGNPVWSPDGEKIVFESVRESGKHDVYIMNADGSDLRNLTNRPNSHDDHPKFFANGKKIIFNSSRDTPKSQLEDDYDYEVYTMDLDGSNQKRILSNSDGWDSYPSISPDGSTMIWRRIIPDSLNERGNSEIFISDTKDINPKNITNHNGFDGYPAWSTDGSKIVYVSTVSEGGVNYPPCIFIMDKDGSNKMRITEPSKDKADVRPWFSPDGKKIVFNRVFGGQGHGGTEILIKILPFPTSS